MNILNLMNISYMNPYVAGLSGGAVAENAYGVSWDESQATGGYARTEDTLGEAVSTSLSDALLPIHANMKRCVINDAGVVQYYLDASNSALKADGVTASVLTGADGQVMVEIPKFWYKYGYSGTTHTWEIANYAKDGYSVHEAFNKNGAEVDYRYMGAYEGIPYDVSGTAYVDGITVGGVAFTGAAGDKLSSVSGFAPWVDDTRAQFRTWAANRGSGWRQQDFDLTSAVQLLYLIEYADWNSQAMIGMGRTELTPGTWVKDSYIGVTGKSNAKGNGTFSVGGDTNNAYMTYRGIENFFGNVWKWVDGFNINSRVPYVCNNDTNFADDTTTNYTALGVTLSTASNDYIKTLEQISRGFLPASLVGSSSTYVCDGYYSSTGWQAATLGGQAAVGAYGGVANWCPAYSSSFVAAYIGARLSY